MQNTLSIASSLGKNDGHAWAMFDSRCSFDHALQGKSLGGPLPSPTWGSWAPPPNTCATHVPAQGPPSTPGGRCCRWTLPVKLAPKNGCPRAAGKLLGNWVPEALVVLQYLEEHGVPMPTLGLAHSVQLLDLIAAIPPFLGHLCHQELAHSSNQPGMLCQNVFCVQVWVKTSIGEPKKNTNNLPMGLTNH